MEELSLRSLGATTCTHFVEVSFVSQGQVFLLCFLGSDRFMCWCLGECGL